jgi:hypothetical protein
MAQQASPGAPVVEKFVHGSCLKGGVYAQTPLPISPLGGAETRLRSAGSSGRGAANRHASRQQETRIFGFPPTFRRQKQWK